MDNIKIKVSKIMTNYSGAYANENILLRIPTRLRLSLGLEMGQQIKVRVSNTSTQVALQVDSAYHEDVIIDDNICYVTSSIFKTINVEGTDDYSLTPVDNITLGTDPEFFLIDRHSKKLLRAGCFFPKWGEIGHDGDLAEIRPKPSDTPEGLTDNIYNLLCNARRIINNSTVYNPENVIMYASSGYQTSTAGFHLHFGLPRDILGNNASNMLLMSQVVKVMDYFVGLPSIVLEGSADAGRRANIFVKYGKPGDFRLDSKTLEYRVVGAHILKHPRLVRGIVALGATVTEDIISKVKLCSNGFKHLYWVQKPERFRELYKNAILSTTDIYRLVCTPDIKEASMYMGRIYNEIKNMIGFGKRQEAINDLFYHIQNNINYENNIEENWRSYYEGVAIHRSQDA